jgi:hypothetical protein
MVKTGVSESSSHQTHQSWRHQDPSSTLPERKPRGKTKRKDLKFTPNLMLCAGVRATIGTLVSTKSHLPLQSESPHRTHHCPSPTSFGTASSRFQFEFSDAADLELFSLLLEFSFRDSSTPQRPSSTSSTDGLAPSKFLPSSRDTLLQFTDPILS